MFLKDDVLLLKKSFDFWDKISPGERDILLSNMRKLSYGAGENIHSADNDCIGVIVVKKGALRTYILSEEGREITLYRLYQEEVCILSASCLLKEITFDVHIDSEIDSDILLINSSIFDMLKSNNIYIENFVYKTIMDKFSDVMWAMQQILFMSFDKRLAVFLLDESARQNRNVLNLTHEQIAKYLGSAREVVSRMLKYFENEKILTTSRGKILLKDRAKLKKILQPV